MFITYKVNRSFKNGYERLKLTCHWTLLISCLLLKLNVPRYAVCHDYTSPALCKVVNSINIKTLVMEIASLKIKFIENSVLKMYGSSSL